MKQSKTNSRRKKILKHLGNVCMSVVWFTLMTSPISAAPDPSDAASQVIRAEDDVKTSKAVLDTLNAGIKLARSKQAMKAATVIVCLSCVSAASASGNPALCIACGILIGKTFG